MRKLILMLMAVVSLTAMSQQLKRVYFFDGFAKGHVMYKNGSKYNVKLNYDANNQVMLFMQGDVMMEMTNPLQVDTDKTIDNQNGPIAVPSHCTA